MTRPKSATAIDAASLPSEDAQQAYESLMLTAPFGYLLVDRHGVIQNINERAARMIGLPRQSLLGVPFMPFVSESDRETVSENCRVRTSSSRDGMRVSCAHAMPRRSAAGIARPAAQRCTFSTYFLLSTFHFLLLP